MPENKKKDDFLKHSLTSKKPTALSDLAKKLLKETEAAKEETKSKKE